MKSLVAKRSIVAAGHKTSVSLEDAFWNSLKRLFVLNFYRNQLADVKEGHDGAEGHVAVKAEAAMQSA